jgi:hypothetical protein
MGNAVAAALSLILETCVEESFTPGCLNSGKRAVG